MEKSQLTTELIGVRAGLSLISILTDNVKKEEEIIKKETEKTSNMLDQLPLIDEQIDKVEDRINTLKYEIENEQESIKENEQNLVYLDKVESEKIIHLDLYKARFSNNFINAYSEELLNQPNKFKKWVNYSDVGEWFKFFGWFFLLGAIIGGISSTIIESLLIIPISFLPIIIGNIIYPIIAGVYNTFILEERNLKCKIKQVNKNLKNKFNKCISNSNKSIKNNNNTIQLLNNDINSLNKKSEELTLEFKQQVSKKNDIVLNCNNNIYNYTNQALSISTALKNTYGSIISESDWENVDLIIHYLETGRADTMKEALYQVDRQRQNDALIRAIKEASLYIGYHIQSAVSSLAKTLEDGFTRLGNNINKMSVQLSGEVKTLSMENAKVTSKLINKIDSQIEISKINSALLEKQNVSSAKLVEDLKYNQTYWQNKVS